MQTNRDIQIPETALTAIQKVRVINHKPDGRFYINEPSRDIGSHV